MRLTLDTNVLVRLAIGDDEDQQKSAVEVLEGAEVVVISLQSLCEFSWVLSRAYKVGRLDIAMAIRGLMNMPAADLDRPATEAGLRLLEAGGDFADGVIAYEGRLRGGETFVSFDRGAVRRLSEQGHMAQLLT